jgi:hypothetical protein
MLEKIKNSHEPMRDLMRHLFKIATTLLFISVSTTACSQENPTAVIANDNRGQATNLCNTEEESIFSCDIDKKNASLCLQQYKGRTYITYRYGSTKKIELTHPDSRSEHTEIFKLSTTPYPGGGENRIRFTIAEYSYYLYDITKTERDEAGQYSAFKSGITILKNSDKILSKSCKNDASITAPAFEILKREEFNYNVDMAY